MAKIAKNFAFDKEVIELLDRLQRDTMQTSHTAVIIYALTNLDKKLNPPYKGVFEARGRTPEQRLDEQIKLDDLKASKKEEKFLEIAKALNGEVYVDEGGEKRVSFYNYYQNHRDEQDYSLNALTPDLIVDQYIPSKEDILKRQKEKKVNYKP